MYQAKNTHVLYNTIMCDPDRVYHTEISDSYKPQERFYQQLSMLHSESS